MYTSSPKIVDHFQIFFDGNPFCKFIHRMPKENVKFLCLGGDMTLNDIRYEANPLKVVGIGRETIFYVTVI